MKKIKFDVMLCDRWQCTLTYEYCPLFPLDEQTLDDTEQEFVCSKCKKSFIGERILNISYETYKCDERGKKIDEEYLK